MIRFDSLKKFATDSPTAFGMLAEDVEQLAADHYAHPAGDGWCCACDADIAFAESQLRESKPELFTVTPEQLQRAFAEASRQVAAENANRTMEMMAVIINKDMKKGIR